MVKKIRSRKIDVSERKPPAVSGTKGRPQAAEVGRKLKAVQESRVAAAKPPRKSPLSKAELEEYRLMLLDKRKALLGDMSGMQAEAFRANRQDRSGDLSNIPIHPADIGSDNYEQEFTLGLLESERTMLREIDEALDRVGAGTYGICMGTGKPINKPRLRARPWAKFCIEYARLIEKGLVPSKEDALAPPDEEEAEGDVEPEAEAETEAEPAEEEPFEEEPVE